MHANINPFKLRHTAACEMSTGKILNFASVHVNLHAGPQGLVIECADCGARAYADNPRLEPASADDSVRNAAMSAARILPPEWSLRDKVFQLMDWFEKDNYKKPTSIFMDRHTYMRARSEVDAAHLWQYVGESARYMGLNAYYVNGNASFLHLA